MEKNNFRKIATITLFESAVQWYCFLLYGTAAGTVFNKVFFSQTGNGTTALILSYVICDWIYCRSIWCDFLWTYCIRKSMYASLLIRHDHRNPAIFFGHIGDRKGRKVTMYASLLMMESTSIKCAREAQELE